MNNNKFYKVNEKQKTKLIEYSCCLLLTFFDLSSTIKHIGLFFENNMKKHVFKGFSLLESLLVLLVTVLACVGLYQVFSPSSTQAAIKQEQEHMENLVDGVFNAYTTSNNFASISTQTVAGVLNAPLTPDGQSLKTAFNTVSATVRPATTLSTNDSFDVVYTGPTSKECVGLVKAISPLSNGVFIGSNASIQTRDGKIANETSISTFCSQSTVSTVAFRFMGQKNSFTASTMNSCVCAPTSETQNVACPTGSSGTITQRRTGLCTGGTPACPSVEWSSWSTVLNTCAVDGANVPTAPAVVVPPDTCIPSVETQTVACPVGQVGGILQQRIRSCPTNTWSGWTQVSSSCQADPSRNLCSPSTRQSSRACPAGQGGQEIVEQTSTCDANGNETWGALKLISSTCTASCVSAGTCCVVGSRTQTQDRLCGNGAYGKLLVQQKQSSTCATATASPVWPSTWIDIQTTGTCTTCPAPSTESQVQDVASSAACPAGQTGTHTWTSRQVRTRTMSYNCPNGAVALPTPDYTAWSAWTETTRLNEVKTCVVAAPSCKNGKWRKDAGSEGYSDAGSTYKYQWSWYNAETKVSGSGSSMPSGLFSNPCPVGSTAIFEWDDGYAGGGTFGYEYHVCETDPTVSCTSPSTPMWKIDEDSHSSSCSSGGSQYPTSSGNCEAILLPNARCNQAGYTCLYGATGGAAGFGMICKSDQVSEQSCQNVGERRKRWTMGQYTWGNCQSGNIYDCEWVCDSPDETWEEVCMPMKSSGNYNVTSDSCSTETDYALPTLQQQASGACMGQDVGYEPATIHHFPSYQVGCYTVVKCE